MSVRRWRCLVQFFFRNNVSISFYVEKENGGFWYAEGFGFYLYVTPREDRIRTRCLFSRFEEDDDVVRASSSDFFEVSFVTDLKTDDIFLCVFLTERVDWREVNGCVYWRVW